MEIVQKGSTLIENHSIIGETVNTAANKNCKKMLSQTNSTNCASNMQP